TVGGGGALVTGELVPGGCIGVVDGAVVVPVVAGDSLGLAVVATVPVGDSAGRRGSVSSEHADTEMVSASARAEVAATRRVRTQGVMAPKLPVGRLWTR